jgi:SAM-dependent methyltransferase
MDVKECDILGPRIDDHWYYVSKGRALLQFLEGCTAREILDVGAGSGFFSKTLLRAGIAERSVCVDTAYEADRVEHSDGKPIRFVREVADPGQDLILMMDVIEHVDDDAGLIRHYTQHMPREGTLLVTVPAFQVLWSGHDVFLEHKRRYTPSRLHRAIEAAGLEAIRTRYFFGMLFPLIGVMRLWGRLRMGGCSYQPRSDLRIHDVWTNAALIGIHEIERRTLFHINRAAGLTIFCLAGKRR